jgi:transposase
VSDPRDERIAVLEAQIALLLKRVTELEAENAALRAKLDESSRNSNKPPSSDTPAQRRERRPKRRSGRGRGGQPGHRGHRREYLPADRTVRRDPRRCRRCKHDLENAEDLEPHRHQVVEVPEIRPDVTDYLLGRRRCDHCHVITRARLPRGVPSGMCGPRLMALIALLTGVAHVSRRAARQFLSDVLGVPISLGTLSEVEGKVADALAPAHVEARAHVEQATGKHIDATSWARSGAPRALWVWASRLATVFVAGVGATTSAVRELIGTMRGILISDRGSQFGFWAMHQRQICWAHLVRKFVAFAEHSHPAAREVGEALLLLAQSHLHAWHRVRDGTLSRLELQRLVTNMLPHVIAHLERGAALRLRGISGACKNLLAHSPALFTYAFVEEIDPTNNHAERELRAFVLWRKRSHGTQSDRGDRFAERVMTTVCTLRKQGRHVLSFLVESCSAALRNQPAPSLFVNT